MQIQRIQPFDELLEEILAAQREDRVRHEAHEAAWAATEAANNLGEITPSWAEERVAETGLPESLRPRMEVALERAAAVPRRVRELGGSGPGAGAGPATET